MDAAAWLARFAAVDEAWRAARSAYHDEVAAKIAAERAPKCKIVAVPIVLESGGVEVDDLVLSTARRVAVAALAAGWAVRAVRAVAAVPGKGIVESWSVRASRHGDERLVAVWWNGSFDMGQYYRRGMACAELLGADRMGAWTPGAVSVEAMTVAQIKALAVERGIKIPSKYVKDAMIEHVRERGLTSATAPVPRRGVLDAIEGLHLVGTR